jgi:DNA-directed RNA polymerase II subunit RPB1
MVINNYRHDENVVNIEQIDFSVMSNKIVYDISAVKDDMYGITLPESYDNFEPKKGGLVDARLGTTDAHIKCNTCGLNSFYCPGHFGHAELSEYVFHAGYLDYIKNILGCICIRCSTLLINKNEEDIKKMLKNKSAKGRFTEIKNLTKNVSYCQRPGYGCGAPVPKIRKEINKSSAAIQIIAEFDTKALGGEEEELGKKKTLQNLTPENCHDILQNMSDVDCKIIGLYPETTRPEDMIIKNFPIPPVAIRPGIRADFFASATYDDSLTHKISDIIKNSNRIRKQQEKDITSGIRSKYSSENLHLLQYHVATYFENESASLPAAEQKSGGKKFKSVSDRLKAKSGRIRGNLMGKRVDFSARTVITSDPYVDINELGVPIKIAMNLTFPEEVTPYNIEYLTKIVRNGRDVYPGANFVIPAATFGAKKQYTIDLRYRKKNIKLRPGDIVERHIVDGDPILFNRQPSLHKLSMMCHLVKVIDDPDLNTFRMNVNATKPYNADFDGRR